MRAAAIAVCFAFATMFVVMFTAPAIPEPTWVLIVWGCVVVASAGVIWIIHSIEQSES